MWQKVNARQKDGLASNNLSISQIQTYTPPFFCSTAKTHATVAHKGKPHREKKDQEKGKEIAIVAV